MSFDIDPADELLHAPGDTPLWRESFWLDAYDHERDIGLIVYSHARPVSGKGDVLGCVLLPGGQRVLYDVHGADYRAAHHGSVAKVADMRYECVTPVSEVSFEISAETLQARLQFRATGPIYDYDWESWTNSRHYEQLGKVAGTITTRSGQLAFDGLGTRDHAWGARAAVPWRRWIWMTVRFVSSGQGWGICLVDADEPLLFGYLAEGTRSEATFARLEMELDDGAKVMSATTQLTAGGRELSASIRPLADVDRAGTDPTKKGGYDYYLVEVEDEDLGLGYGLLDVFSTPGLDPRSAGAVEATKAL